ncbi:uncharacterized mitochondrial protein AtMg00810-like [Lactuca sativa]|uniref:uncharacterized mitochondrial protein AtMg00810-like n=1 Tax=Lactuca sativa TaxID=4236 RepID=UPI000CD875E2|nr:uncharacterized mitochondrial protein AtMg00810-like [Lactuca sativa]
MSYEFEMSHLGALSYYLGIEITQQSDGLVLKQTAYAKNILAKTCMTDINSSQYPMEHNLEPTKDEQGVTVNAIEYISIVGGLRYLCYTRRDISYAVGIVGRFLERPTTQHHQAVKKIIRG